MSESTVPKVAFIDVTPTQTIGEVMDLATELLGAGFTVRMRVPGPVFLEPITTADITTPEGDTEL